MKRILRVVWLGQGSRHGSLRPILKEWTRTSSVAASEAESWTSASYCSDPPGGTVPPRRKIFTSVPHQLRRPAACMACAAIMQRKWRHRGIRLTRYGIHTLTVVRSRAQSISKSSSSNGEDVSRHFQPVRNHGQRAQANPGRVKDSIRDRGGKTDHRALARSSRRKVLAVD